MLVVQAALALVLDQLLHEAARAFTLIHARLRLAHELEIQRAMVPPDVSGRDLPRGYELGQIFEERKRVNGRSGAGLEECCESVLDVVEGLHLWGLEPLASLPENRSEDHGCGVPLNVLVVPLWFAEDVVYSLHGFSVLERKHIRDLAWNEKRLDCSP